MKHAIIVAHPSPQSFNLTMARTYQATVEQLGCVCVLRDLYRILFDPRLRDGEIPRPEGFAPGEDVLRERELIGDADVFALIYPLWFNSPPAMMKGYLERVFGMGFGYRAGGGGLEGLLRGCSLISISSSGAPEDWVVETGGLSALQRLVDEHFSQVCGLSIVEHVHFGQIAPGITSEAVDDCARSLADRLKFHFGPAKV